MSNLIRAKNVRVYKDGSYLGTLTDVSIDSTQNIVSRDYIGDSEMNHIPTNKEFSGSMTRDSFDESWLEAIVGRVETTNFSVANYTNDPDTLRGTVDNLTDVDITFTTPATSGLKIERIDFNAKKVGSFAGGLDVLIRDSGDTTTVATFSVDAGDIPTNTNRYVTALLNPESAEVALTSSTSYILRFTASGTPTGDVELYGPVSETYAITAVDTVGDSFTVAGDQTESFKVGERFSVTGSTGNNGTYTVDSAVVSGADTVITVNEDITNVTADGTINVPIDLYFSVTYETSDVEAAHYIIDFVMETQDGNEVVHVRDTEVTFTNNTTSINAGELVTEATGWQSKRREIL